MKRYINQGLFFLSALILGCSSNNISTSMAPVPGVHSRLNQSIVWNKHPLGRVRFPLSNLRPEYKYDKIFIADYRGLVKALDPVTGNTIWSKDLGTKHPAELSGGIVAGLNKVFIGSEDGRVYALDEKSGDQVWTTRVSGEVLSPPAVDRALVLVSTSRDELIAVDPDSGKKKWVIPAHQIPSLSIRGSSTPLTASDSVFWGTASGYLAMASLSSGKLVSKSPIDLPRGVNEIDRIVDVDSSPLITGSMLFATAYQGELIAFDLKSGTVKWKHRCSSVLDMISDGVTIFLSTEKDHIVALDIRSGKERWINNKLENRLVTAPVLVGGHVVVGDSQGYLYWIDLDTGNFVSKQLIDSSGFSIAPIALPGGCLVLTKNGSLKKIAISSF